MRVLVVTAYYPNHGGGIEIVAQQILRQLVGSGFDFTWCALDCDPAPENTPGLTCNPVSGSNFFETFVRIPFPLVGPKSILELWKSIKLSDVIHLHDFIYPSNFISWLFAKIHKKPVIITQHIGLVPYRNPLFRLSFTIVNHTLGRMMLNRSTHVVFIANHVQDYFASICRRTKPHWHYIPNGVDSKVFNTTTTYVEPDSTCLPQLPKEPFVLFVGRFVEKKGLVFLKDLVRMCGDIQWVFVGKGPIDPKSWGLSNVTTIEHIDHEGVSTLYRRASLLVLPSVGEGFPLVIQEAVACGTPVLTSHETSRGCTEADSFLFSSDIHSKDAVSNWERKIRDLLNDKTTLASASREGALFAEKNWNWSSISKRYESIFRQACSC